MSLETLKTQLGEVRNNIDALDIVKENGNLSEEQEKRYDDLLTQAERLMNNIKKEKRNAAIKSFVDEPVNVKQEAVKEDRSVDSKVSNDIKVVDDTKNYRFGEFLCDIIKASRPGVNASDRLNRHQRKALQEQRAILGNSESVPSDGGFLVDKDMGSFLEQRVYNNNELLSRSTRFSISSNSNGIKIPGFDETSRADGSRFGGTRGYWIAEGASKTSSNPSFRQIDLELNKLVVLNYLTDELMQDASAIEQYVTQAASEELNFKIQDAIYNGDGAGKPQGIMNANCLVTVAKETGQAADTIVYENITKMYSRIWRPSDRRNKIWIANQDIIPQLMSLSLAVGTGGSAAWLPANGLADQPFDTLMGIPIIYIEQAATLGDAGDLMLADMSQYYVADKGGVQSASSIHVQFTTDQTVLRWVFRVDGQASWNSALTPFKGSSNTVSPFVRLAARA